MGYEMLISAYGTMGAFYGRHRRQQYRSNLRAKRIRMITMVYYFHTLPKIPSRAESCGLHSLAASGRETAVFVDIDPVSDFFRSIFSFLVPA